MNRERIRQEHQPDVARAAEAQETTAPTVSTHETLSPQQRGMLSAQQTIGNRAAIQRMMVQRDDPAPPTGIVTGEQPGGQSLSGSGGSVTVDGSGVKIDSSGPLVLNAPSIETNTAMLGQPGVTRTGTIIADSVVGSSYTPGAGNVW